MVREALTGYWSLVSGLTEVTVERARAAARAMLAQSEATRDQVTGLAQEITEASRSNREALLKLVRYEAERAAGRLGFASTDEVTTLQGRVRELERSIAELRVVADAVTGPVTAAAADRPVARPAGGPVAGAAGGPEEPGAAEPAAPVAPVRTEKAAPARAGRKAPAKATEKKPAKATKAAKASKASKPAKATKAAEPTKAAKATKATKAAKAAPRKRAGGGE